jgi:hypothetical protein
MVIWYIFPRFGLWSQEKSGNPAPNTISTAWFSGAVDIKSASVTEDLSSNPLGEQGFWET